VPLAILLVIAEPVLPLAPKTAMVCFASMLIVLMKIIAQTICPFYGGKSSKKGDHYHAFRCCKSGFR
jgi:hypothetical protein